MKKILIVMLCCFFITKLAAQEKQYYHQLGASVSMFSGIGLSYKYFFTDIIAAKVTGMFYSDEYNNGDSYYYSNYGAEFQMYIDKS